MSSIIRCSRVNFRDVTEVNLIQYFLVVEVVSKTVVYPMFGEREGIEITKDIFDRTGVPQDHKHYKDTRMRVSPHILKCTRYQGKEYMMGQCEIDIS